MDYFLGSQNQTGILPKVLPKKHTRTSIIDDKRILKHLQLPQSRKANMKLGVISQNLMQFDFEQGLQYAEDMGFQAVEVGIAGLWGRKFCEIDKILSEKGEIESQEKILHVNVAPAAAVEFQHFQNKILEKINSFFGYKAISRIVLHHVPYLKKVNKIPKINIHKKKLTLEQKKSIEKVTEGIDSKKLEKALFKLGKSILVDKDQ